MNRTTALVMSWSLLCVPASGLVGDVPTAEWTIRRQTVMVYSARGRCSGVVVAQDLVLTAAHCLEAADKYKIVGHVDGKPQLLADVTELVSHPQFDRTTKPTTADLALLKLSKPLPIGFAPAFFAVRPVDTGDRLIVVGYGIAANNDRKSFGTPRMATLSVSNLTANLLVLTDRSGNRIGGCSGDSGGPAFSIKGGVPALAGIVSAGNCRDTSFVIPSTPYRDWIRETARKLGSALNSW